MAVTKQDTSQLAESTTMSHVTQPKWAINRQMNEELDALYKNHTQDIVACPSSAKPIRCKWIYPINLNSDGSLDQYKSQARGSKALGNR